MRRPKRILEKKYISTLVIAAFLVLSVLTANNIRMGDANTKESDTETKETISQSGNRRDYGTEDDYSGEDQDTSDNRTKASRDRDLLSGSGSSTEQSDGNTDAENSKSTKQEEKTGVIERDTEENESKGMAGASDDNTSDKFHYDGSTKLTWPVLGNVILPYSMDTTVYYTTLDQYACSEGILIGTRAGDEVKAAADGRVVNISETDRYGTMMTVLIGDYYELYYAQMDNVKLDIGDEVKEGEIIGTVAEPTRSFLLEGPHLYFKMTYKGESVNPAEYLR